MRGIERPEYEASHFHLVSMFKMRGFIPPFRHMSSWHSKQELPHFHISYKLLELLCFARSKDVAVVRFMSLKNTVGVYGIFQH
jgi:hypothetical protein